MILREALQDTIIRFSQAGIPEGQLDAEYLVAEAAGLSRLKLPLHGHRAMSVAEKQRLDGWVRDRLERKPLAYILGDQPFRNLSLRVTPAVLVPRPETEWLVEEVYQVLDKCESAIAVDVGTGSGAIAISLAKHPRVARVHAIDLSSAALQVARENAQRNTVKTPIYWHQGDLLAPLSKNPVQVDLVVANLPYIRSGDIPKLAPEVQWEPRSALDGGSDGLECIQRLIDQNRVYLKSGGHLFLEIGYDQGAAVMGYLAKRSCWKNVQLKLDLAELPRIISAQLATGKE